MDAAQGGLLAMGGIGLVIMVCGAICGLLAMATPVFVLVIMLRMGQIVRLLKK